MSLSHIDKFKTFNHCCPDIKIIYPTFSIDNWRETFADRGLELNQSIYELNEVYKQWTLVWLAPHLQVKLKTAFISVYMYIFVELFIVEKYLQEWF